MIQRKQAGIALTLAWLFAACCSNAAAEIQTVTEEQNGESVTLTRGEQLKVILPGNPTTGYSWIVPQEIQATLSLQDSSYTPESSAIGGGGHFTYLFVAQQTGSLQLIMRYARGWETTDSVDSFLLNVTIVPRASEEFDGSEGEEELEKPEAPEHPTDPYAARIRPPTTPTGFPEDPEHAADPYPARIRPPVTRTDDPVDPAIE